MKMQRSTLGFSIPEFMIAIALGMIIILSVLQIYLGNRKTFEIEDALARLQENGRFVNFILNQDLRMAGYLGCSKQKSIVLSNLVLNPRPELDFTRLINGYDGFNASTFNPALPSNLTGVPVGSDVIEVRMAAPGGTLLSANMASATAPAVTASALGLQNNDPAIITNCVVGDLFLAGTGSSGTSINHTTSNNTQNAFSATYQINAQVARALYYAYYIKNTGRTNGAGNAVYALMRKDVYGNEMELAEGVERMRIRYGVDTNADNTVDSYQTAAQVNTGSNWDNVLSVQISLLFTTTEEVSPVGQGLTFYGVTSPNDRKLRRQWEVFVAFRNRGL